MLTIGKPAEFSANNFPVRGQCQPHTKGWRLRLFSRGKEELICEDTYYTCRQIQKECVGMALDAVREKAKELLAAAPNLLETQIMPTESKTVKVPGTRVDLPPVDPLGEKTGASGGMETEVIPREEQEREMQKRRKPFDR